MDIMVSGKHFSVPPNVEERAQEKLQHLEHFLPLLSDGACDVEVAYEQATEPDQRFVGRGRAGHVGVAEAMNAGGYG